MKNFYKIFPYLFISIIFFACQNDTRVDIKVSPLDTLVKKGDTIIYKYTLTPDAKKGKIGTLFVEDSQGKVVLSKNYSTVETIKDECVYVVSDSIGDLLNLSLNFSVIDENSGIENKISTIINLKAYFPNIFVFTEIQAAFEATNLQSQFIFEIATDKINLQNGEFTKGDLAFVFDSIYGYSILSPDAIFIKDIFAQNGINYITDNKNTTKIQRYSGNWDELTDEKINSLEIVSTEHQGGGFGVGNLKKDDILIFETSDGVKGALKINLLVKNTNYISADIKFQKK